MDALVSVTGALIRMVVHPTPFLRRFPTPVKHGWQMQATPTTFEPSSEPHTGSVSSSGRNHSFALASGSTSASPHQRESAHKLILLPRTYLYPLPPSSFKSQNTRMDARGAPATEGVSAAQMPHEFAAWEWFTILLLAPPMSVRRDVLGMSRLTSANQYG